MMKLLVTGYLLLIHNTNAVIQMSLRVKRSNLIAKEIATPLGLAMTV